MKKIFILLLCFNAFYCFSQQTISLSKEETISYINKNLRQGIGGNRTPKSGGTTLYFFDLAFTEFNNQVQFSTERSNYKVLSNNCDYYFFKNWNNFYPSQIVNIEEDVKQEGSTLGLIKISLVSKTARENQKAYNYSQQNENGKCSQLILNDEKEFSNDVVFIPFVDSDPSNFLKLKRALEHLKDIYKKEDKPYAN